MHYDFGILPFPILLLLLAVGAFFQNAAFTWVSRSRNSRDVGYHRKAAWCSNSIWFVIQLLIMNTVLPALTHGAWWKLIIVGVVYTLSTTEGSCAMMAKLLKTESGNRRVGA